MKAKGLVWLGTRTRNFDDTVRFFGDTLGLNAVHEEPDFTVFKLPNGDTVEVFGPTTSGTEHFDTGPVAGFLVDDVAGARGGPGVGRGRVYGGDRGRQRGLLVPL